LFIDFIPGSWASSHVRSLLQLGSGPNFRDQQSAATFHRAENSRRPGGKPSRRPSFFRRAQTFFDFFFFLLLFLTDSRDGA
jgi:hypothetical protein